MGDDKCCSGPVANKYTLTIKEAAKYFNIGEKKLRWLLNEHYDEDFGLKIGNKTLIKRKKFEKFIDEVSEI